VGISRVFVGVTGVSFEEGSGVAHFLQNSESEVFSVLHLGHFIPSVPLYYSEKEYQLMRKESN
jgi:uncharacterized cupin superfamily protein